MSDEQGRADVAWKDFLRGYGGDLEDALLAGFRDELGDVPDAVVESQAQRELGPGRPLKEHVADSEARKAAANEAWESLREITEDGENLEADPWFDGTLPFSLELVATRGEDMVYALRLHRQLVGEILEAWAHEEDHGCEASVDSLYGLIRRIAFGLARGIDKMDEAYRNTPTRDPDDEDPD